MAMKVYGPILSTATQRVLACLSEKGLDYELIPIDLSTGQHKQKPFLSRSPFGKVPAFEHGDLKLFESRAITKYIANTYAENGTPLVFQDTKRMAIVDVSIEVEAHHFDPAASKLVWELVIVPFMGLTTDEAAVNELEAKLAKVLDVYEARLAESKYLSGEAFGLADLHHLPTVDYLMGTRVKAVFDARPRVSAWCKDILARPAWQKVVAKKNSFIN